MLLVAAAAVGVLAVGPASEQTPAAVVLILILAMLVVQPGGTKAAWSRLRERERRAQFGPQLRAGQESVADDAELDGAWERERERREREQLERERS